MSTVIGQLPYTFIHQYSQFLSIFAGLFSFVTTIGFHNLGVIRVIGIGCKRDRGRDPHSDPTAILACRGSGTLL